MDQWVKRLKFSGDWALAIDMARLMRESPELEHQRKQADWILPMPVSRERLIERGYNQAAWLAKQWCGRDHRLKVHWLVKIRHTGAQAQAHRAQRVSHLQGSMALNENAWAAMRGAQVLLVDDVMTTGATLEVASACVLQAGATRVDVAVFARTPPTLDATRH
jgi:ComF family protein